MAYEALNSNPDLDRRHDSLRDLVKKLLDERKLDVLMQFNYGNLEQLFCEIISTRARATDAMNNIYYEFLYAYHIRRGSLLLRLGIYVTFKICFNVQLRSSSLLINFVLLTFCMKIESYFS